jgi:GTP-binding protein
MDSHDLEKEKGITINSKVTSMTYKDYTINIVDTPGHQDFGGEVERILSMVDGVILVVCGTEGTKRQTKFVLQKAIEHNLMPLVVVNKIDRDTCDLDIVQNSISDLVCDVAPDESYLEYDTLYTSAVKEFLYENEEDIGKEDKKKGMNVILERVIDYFPAPKFNEDQSSF